MPDKTVINQAATAQAAEFSEQELERGRLLFAGPVTFVKGVVALDGLPASDRAEVTFAGRSNVGKSSLINALTGRKGLARTSNTPGRTQELNYFEMTAGVVPPLYLVDLPGYGYAKIERRKVEAWTQLVKNYLSGRANLRRVFLLIDSRHGIKPGDKEIMTMLDQTAVNYQLVLTKIDKLRVADREKIHYRVQKDAMAHPACHPLVLVTSSEKGWGLSELRAEIASLALA